MPLFPIPKDKKIRNDQKMKENGEKLGKPVTEPKSSEVRYRNSIYTLTDAIRTDTDNIIIPLLQRLEPLYVKDSYQDELEQAMASLLALYTNVDKFAKNIASKFVADVESVNRERFRKSVNSAFGIDLNRITQTEGLEATLKAATSNNVSLIKSIPSEYFKKLKNIIYTETIKGSTVASINDQIMALYCVTEGRAKLIARDQTSKLNSNLTQQRAEALGSVKFIWRTAEDSRVRKSHADKNGNIYEWANPPSDTRLPGDDVQCRCIAQAIYPEF